MLNARFLNEIPTLKSHDRSAMIFLSNHEREKELRQISREYASSSRIFHDDNESPFLESLVGPLFHEGGINCYMFLFLLPFFFFFLRRSAHRHASKWSGDSEVDRRRLVTDGKGIYGRKKCRYVPHRLTMILAR